MLPRWHILLGLIFSLGLMSVFPEISLLNITLVFLASFLIDFDHYVNAVVRTKSISLLVALEYYKKVCKRHEIEHKKGIFKREEEFQFFHTIETFTIVALLGFAWSGFFYILIGAALHIILDIIYLNWVGYLYLREFSIIHKLLKKPLNKEIKGKFNL